MSPADLAKATLWIALVVFWQVDPLAAQSTSVASAAPTVASSPVEVFLSPEGGAADQLAQHVREALFERLVFVRIGPRAESPSRALPDTVAMTTHIEVDLGDPEILWIRVRGLPGGPHVRGVARNGDALDESTLEAATTVIAMAAESLRAANEHARHESTSPVPLPAQPEDAAASIPTQEPTQDVRVVPVSASVVRRDGPQTTPPQVVNGVAIDETPRARSVATQVSLGYEVMRWGPGLWPQGLVAGARMGPRASNLAVRVAAFATPTRARFEGPPVLSLAVYGARALCVYGPSLVHGLTLELGAGMAAYAVRAQAIETSPLPTLREASWQTHLVFHATLALGYLMTPRLLLAAAAGVDADRTQVVYGTQYRDGFAAKHYSSRARPSFSLGLSVRF